MKCVDRKTFLELPDGTAFFKGEKWAFDGLRFKETTVGGVDWYAVNPAWVEGNGFQSIDRLEHMLSSGASYPMQDSTARDGLFDAEAIFLIPEHDDLLLLQKWISRAIDVSAS